MAATPSPLLPSSPAGLLRLAAALPSTALLHANLARRQARGIATAVDGEEGGVSLQPPAVIRVAFEDDARAAAAALCEAVRSVYRWRANEYLPKRCYDRGWLRDLQC